MNANQVDLIYRKAAKEWGESQQVVACVEELCELGQALAKLVNSKGDPDALRLRVEEEIADVEIMIEQMRYHFDGYQIDVYKKMKLKRLADRLKISKPTLDVLGGTTA